MIRLVVYSSFHAKLFPFSLWNQFCYSLHFRHQISITFVTTHPDSVGPTPPTDFEHDELKSPGRLNGPLSSDVHPFNICDGYFTLLVAGVKNDLVVIKNE